MVSPVNELPTVRRVQGAMFNPGPTPKESEVVLQYTDAKDQWHQLKMPFLDAMYLLSILKGMQLDLNYPFPDDPRGDFRKKPFDPNRQN